MFQFIGCQEYIYTLKMDQQGGTLAESFFNLVFKKFVIEIFDKSLVILLFEIKSFVSDFINVLKLMDVKKYSYV